MSSQDIEEIIDGAPFRTRTLWYDDGTMRLQEVTRNNLAHGTWQQWDSSGNKIEETEYEYGDVLISDNWEWYSSGQMKKETKEEHEEGIKFWNSTEWYENGKEKSRTYKENDQYHDVQLSWFDNGQLHEHKEYENGQKIGEWKSWHSNGEISMQGSYQDDLETGTWTWWNWEGKKSDEKSYIDGFLTIWNTWNWSDDILWSTTLKEYKDEKEYKAVIDYHTFNGKMWKRTEYIDGILNGEYSEWYQNGQLREHGPYKDGEKHGLWKEWHDNGQKKYQGQFKHGEKTGTHMSWWDDGTLEYQWTYYGTYHTFKDYRIWHEFGGAWAWGWETGAHRTSDNEPCGTWAGLDYDGDYQWNYEDGYMEKILVPRPWSESYGACPPAEVDQPYPDPVENEHEIRGSVVDKRTGELVPEAIIKAGTTGSIQATSDADGFYILNVASADSTKIVAEKEGYYTYSSIVSLGDFQTVTCNIELRKKVGDIPAITNVESQYGGLFLQGIPVQNKYTVSVDWNGEPGEVIFEVNGSGYAAQGTESGAEYSIDMGGSAFLGSLSAKGNILKIVAANEDELESEPDIRYPIVIPVPDWSQSLGSFGDISYEGGLVTYNLEKTWPEDPIEIQINETTLGSTLWSAWSLIPLIGGRNFGIPPTQATLEVEAQSDGAGSVTVKGTTGFEAAGQEIETMIGGKGNLQYETGNGLLWKGANLLMGIEGTIKKEVGPVTLIPALEGAVNLWGIGRLIKWFNSLAVINGSINTGGAVDILLISETGNIGFNAAEGELAAGIGLGLSCGTSKLSTSLSGGGSSKVLWQVPADPNYLKQIEANLYAKLGVNLWLYEDEFEASHTFTYPEASGQSIGERSALESGLKPISRDFLTEAPYSQFMLSTGRTALSAASSGNTNETEIIQNIYPYSEPAIAENAGKIGIAFVYFDPADTTLQATEIYFSYYDGGSYTTPAPILDDTRAEFAPALAFDAAGKVLCVWERVKDENFSGENVSDMAETLEIVYAVYDPVTQIWTSPVPLTDNGYLDHSPVIRQGPGGEILLVWVSNQGNMLVGDTSMPDTLHYGFWNSQSQSFDDSGSFPNIANALKFSTAYNGSNAVIAFAKDMDDDLSTVDDEEIYVVEYNDDAGVWTGPTRLTNDDVPDINPQVVYRTDGTAELIWLRGDTLVRLSDWVSGAFEIVRTDSSSVTFTDFKAFIDPYDRLVLVWQEIDGEKIDLFYRVYDPDNNLWSRDLRLTDDEDMEKDFAGLISSDSTLHLVYNKENRETHANDLYHFNYTLSKDLSVTAPALTIEPQNPAPGTTATLFCTVENTGDIALAGVQISFYRGDPDDSGQLINTANVVPSVLGAGEQGEASISWSIPADAPYNVYAVVDADDTIIESNESNNKTSFYALRPDLEAVRCKTETFANEDVVITAFLRNNGLIPAEDVEVVFSTDSVELERVIVSKILAETGIEVSRTVSGGAGFAPRENKIRVDIDPDNLIAEIQEDNNQASTLLRINNFAYPKTLDFLGIPQGNASTPLTITLTNSDETDFNIIALDLSDTTDFILDVNAGSNPIGALPANISPGESRTLTIVFTPASEGAFNEYLAVCLTDPESPDAIISLSGTGVASPSSGIFAVPANYLFNDVVAGDASAAMIASIYNRNEDDITISGVYLSDTTNFTPDSSGGPNSLEGSSNIIPAGEFRTVAVTFNPLTAGSHSAALIITPDDTDIFPVNITLSGAGVPGPRPGLLVAPDRIYFEDILVGESSNAIILNISNPGAADLNITQLSLSDTENYSLDTGGGANPIGNVSGIIQAGTTKTVSITFSPDSSNLFDAALVIDSDAYNMEQTSVPLSGTGLSADQADIAIIPTGMNFGSVEWGSATQANKFTVSNASTAELDIGSIVLTGLNAGDFSIPANTCADQTLYPYDTCTIDIVFFPGTKGTKIAELSISSNDPDTQELIVPLTGQATMKIFQGDINGDETVGLADAVLALQVLVGSSSCSEMNCISMPGDVAADGKIGFKEIIYILQEISELR
ncbi:choice-of-anchor D domain-containing protein [Thermodesulfobacteriota bacterium]